MTSVYLPGVFSKYFSGRTQVTVAASSLADVFRELDKIAPGFSGLLLGKNGTFKNFVRVYVNEALISEGQDLSEVTVPNQSKVDIVVALVGG